MQLAAQAAIDAHHVAAGLEDGHGPSVALYHLLASLETWAALHDVDLDTVLAQVRADDESVNG